MSPTRRTSWAAALATAVLAVAPPAVAPPAAARATGDAVDDSGDTDQVFAVDCNTTSGRLPAIYTVTGVATTDREGLAIAIASASATDSTGATTRTTFTLTLDRFRDDAESRS
ncbi:hypothetical protein ABT144_19000 [Streptomyces sp. NPDC002039]|uniref:hypothetical protein n=1 Tax=Streptomyces sp. NPDC002039 TaxID=3154660 RepID=UPI003332C379